MMQQSLCPFLVPPDVEVLDDPADDAGFTLAFLVPPVVKFPDDPADAAAASVDVAVLSTF